MAENPFDEPGDQDRTIIRPAPGGSRAGARPAPPTHPTSARAAAEPPAVTTARSAARPAAPAAAVSELEPVDTGDGPLAIAAAPLLQLLARLRNTATPPEPGEMRDRTRRELRAFERRAKAAGVAMDQMRLAHYALCATLDDVVLNTPWGSQGRWKQEPLCLELHQDEQSGRGFFDQLRTLRTALPASMPVVKLMFVCLSLGMMGPYRTAQDGLAQLERVRHQVFGMIEAEAAGATLSESVAGVRPPPPPRGGLPVWVAGSAALGVIAAVFVGCLGVLNQSSDAFYKEALAAPPAAMPDLVRPAATPPPPPPPPPATPDTAARLRTALTGVAGIEVIGTPAAAIIRIPAATLFPAANATVAPGPLLERVAAAVGVEPGPIRVQAFTDSQPTRSVAFPSKFALTSARANAVKSALAGKVPGPARLAAEGRADADPIGPNTTAEGREQNRRVEIVLSQAP